MHTRFDSLKTSCLNVLAFFFVSVSMLPSSAFGFPSAEVTASGGPPFDFGVSGRLSGFLLTNDTTLFLSFGEVLKVIDTTTYTAATSQPAALSVTDKTDGIIKGIAYDSSVNDMIASQSDGDLLTYNLDDISTTPMSLTLKKSADLGPLAVDSSQRIAYVANNTDKSIIEVDLGGRSIKATIPVKIGVDTSFIFTGVTFNAITKDFYFTTDKGGIFLVQSGSAQATLIDVDTQAGVGLKGGAPTPDGAFIYCVDSTTPGLVKIDASSHTVLKKGKTIDLSANPEPTHVVITQVKNPKGGSGTATYAFIAGSKGVSVVDVATDEVLDLGTSDTAREPIPTSSTPNILAASSSTDGSVYLGTTTGRVGLLSANPWISVSSLTYADGATKLGLSGSATLVFQSTVTGDYEMHIGGGIDAGGPLLTVTGGGSAKGSVGTAATDISVAFTYEDNKSNFLEGENKLLVFVTDASGNRGRKAAVLTVDTPPPVVSLQNIGFGTEKIYINFDRLTAADMNHYNVYISPDASLVTTKTDVDLQVSQPQTGSTVTAEKGGLTNGTTYYIAVEGVDAAGNASPSRSSTLPDGTRATGLPEVTVGPVGLSDEAGCALVPVVGRGEGGALLLFIALMLLLVTRSHLLRKQMMFMVILSFFSLFFIQESLAERKQSPQIGSIELKTGFWLPASRVVDSFFGACCNLITRVEGGVLFQRRYGIEGGVGIFSKGGRAIGVDSERESQDHFDLLLVPMETNLVFRADFFRWRWLIPFAKSGADYVFFRESTGPKSINGMKYGMHAGGGFQLRLSKLTDQTSLMDVNYGVNDLFAIFEAQYSWINNFGSRGLNLSGPVYSVGVLFEF